MSFKWTDLIPSFIGAAKIQDAFDREQLELLRKIYNQDFGGRQIHPPGIPFTLAWLARWQPGRKDQLQ